MKKLGNLRAKLKAKTEQSEWLEPRRLRFLFLLLFVVISGVVLVSVVVGLFVLGQDVVYTPDPSKPITFYFVKDADYKFRFVPSDSNATTVSVRKNILFVCDFPAPANLTINEFRFAILYANGTTVPYQGYENPCEVELHYPRHRVLPPIYFFGDDHRYVNISLDSNMVNRSGEIIVSKFSTLMIHGTFFETRLEDAEIERLSIDTVQGEHLLYNVTIKNDSVISTNKAGILLQSRAPFRANFQNNDENLCIMGPATPSKFSCTPGFFQSPCNTTELALNPALANSTQCQAVCSDGTVEVGDTGSVPPLSVPTHTFVTPRGGIQAIHLPLGSQTSNLGAPWQGFGGNKYVNFTREDYSQLATALHTEGVSWDMLYIRIKGPGAPKGAYIWARKDVFLRLTPALLSVMSAGLLNPAIKEMTISLGQGFCPHNYWSRSSFGFDESTKDTQRRSRLNALVSPDLQIETNPTPDLMDRKVELWQRIKEAIRAPEKTDIAIREACLGNFIFTQDPISDKVTRYYADWTKNPTFVAVVLISVILSVLIGLGVGLLIRVIYKSQVKKKQAELLLRLRSLKSQGYYPLGAGYTLYHSPPDPSRWKQDFFVGDPFGRISALRSIQEYKGFADVFRALNNQRYGISRIQLEDESAVKRSRLKRAEIEDKAAQTLSSWYRNSRMLHLMLGAVDVVRQGIARQNRQEVSMKLIEKAKHSADMVDSHEVHIQMNDNEALAEALEARKQREIEIEKEKQQLAEEKRQQQDRLEASKLEQRSKKLERAEEELLVYYYVGPFLFLSIFLETLFLTFWPGIATKNEYNKDAAKDIKKLMTFPSRANTLLAITKALKINNPGIRDAALDHIKLNARDQIDIVNQEIRRFQQRRDTFISRITKRITKVLGQEVTAQFGTVLSHVIALFFPPIVIILCAYVLVTTFTTSKFVSVCIDLNFKSWYAFLFGYVFYIIAYIKLGMFYLEYHSIHRLRLRRVFNIVLLILIMISVALVSLVIFWVLLGLLLNPTKAGPPATAIATMFGFVTSQYRRINEMRLNLKRQIESFIGEKFQDAMKKISNMEDLIDRIVSEMGLSLRNISVVLFGSILALAAIFAFIFVGVYMFQGQGAALALIQSGLALLSGVGMSLLKGKETAQSKDKFKMKVPTLIRDMVESVVRRGIDSVMAKGASLAAGGGAAAAAAAAASTSRSSGPGYVYDIRKDTAVTGTLYGAVKVVRESDTIKNVMEFEVIQIKSALKKENTSLARAADGDGTIAFGPDDASMDGALTGRSLALSMK